MFEHRDGAAHPVEHHGESTVWAMLGARREPLPFYLQQPIAALGDRTHLAFGGAVVEHEILVGAAAQTPAVDPRPGRKRVTGPGTIFPCRRFAGDEPR